MWGMLEGDQIVLIEDDEDKAKMIMTILRRDLAASVRHFDDGQSALDFLFSEEGKATKLILLDLILPTVDGTEILRRIKNDAVRSMIPVVILTTSSQTQSYVEGLGLHPDGYIHKPNSLKNCA
jgi:two-component system, response regulator